jgi:hypothetical protein
VSHSINCPQCGYVITTTDLTVLESLLTSYSRSQWHGSDNGWSEFMSSQGEVFEIPGLGKVTVVDRVGGYEDAGSYMHLVFKVIDFSGKESYYRKSGTYDSWDASVWDGPFVEVTATTKTVTTFEVVRPA